jgi:hypothetical protein
MPCKVVGTLRCKWLHHAKASQWIYCVLPVLCVVAGTLPCKWLHQPQASHRSCFALPVLCCCRYTPLQVAASTPSKPSINFVLPVLCVVAGPLPCKWLHQAKQAMIMTCAACLVLLQVHSAASGCRRRRSLYRACRRCSSSTGPRRS